MIGNGETQSISKKMLEVMKDCARIPKEGKNSYHKYKYVRSEDVLARVNPALTNAGLVTIYHNPEIIRLQERDSSGGTSSSLITVRVTIRIIDTDSGEWLEIQGIGSGMDNGDKAVAKAQTQAIKYAWLATLAISTGDDPEADSYPDKEAARAATKGRPTSCKALQDEITTIVKERMFKPEAFLNLLSETYDAENLSSLSQEEKEELLDLLRQNRIVTVNGGLAISKKVLV